MKNRGASPPPSIRSKYDTLTAKTAQPPLTRNDIHVALDGITRAEDLVAKHQLSKALKVYQDAIGVLIRGASEGIPGIDSNLLKERAGVALGDAEKVKARIKPAVGTVAPIRQGVKKTNSVRRNTTSQSYPQPIRRSSSHQDRTRGRGYPSPSIKSSASYDSDSHVQTIKNDILLSNPPNIHWGDIAGLRNAKRALQEAVILPLVRPDLYTGLRSAPRGILLYGPPGTGKTMLAKTAANESGCRFFSCSSSSLLSKWHGEGEKILKALFRYAAEVSPSIIFFDEIDALMSTRKSEEHEASRRFKTEFMIQVDGALSDRNDGKVLILGCTNCPWDLDDAVTRRFQRRIYVPLPDEEARRFMLESLLEKNVNCIGKKDVGKLVKMTDGYSCSDLASVGREAAFGPLRDLGEMEAIKGASPKDLRPISYKDFKDAIDICNKSVSAGLLRRYDEWEREQSGGN